MTNIHRRGFASDNNASVHPQIMAALQEVNQGHAIAYGDDPYTERAINAFKQVFGQDIEVYFAYNGTGANVLGLSAATRSYHGIICTDQAHLQVDECCAPEHFIGCKLLPVSATHGKLKVEDIRSQLTGIGDQHHVQPHVVSITQATELGTVYNVKELKALTTFAHDNNLLMHMDGARIANAAVSLNTSLSAMTREVGIDILSFGGTKNGLMFGEAIIFLRPSLADGFKFLRKQGMQLASKMRYIAAQYYTLLEENIWYENARHANQQAAVLANEIKLIKGVEITQPVQANAVFCLLPKTIIDALREHYFFYVWDERNNEEKAEIRLMTSYDTKDEDIKGFIKQLNSLL